MRVNLKIKNGMEFNIEFDEVAELIEFVENFACEKTNNVVSLDNLIDVVKSSALVYGAAKKIADSRKEKESDEDYEGENYDFYNDYDYFDEEEDCE
jgi:hypothetical protein